MSAPPAARDGAQAQATQVRLPGVQGRASLDGAPLHPLRPPANKMKVHCSRHVQAFTHTHTRPASRAASIKEHWLYPHCLHVHVSLCISGNSFIPLCLT